MGNQKNELAASEQVIDEEQFYSTLRSYVVDAQEKIYRAVNDAMVTAYWKIGKDIHNACGENDRAPYGKKLLQMASKRLTSEFGKGFTVPNLRNMRQFHRMFPDIDMVRPELSWTHYRSLMRVQDDEARVFYLEEAVKSSWSTRQLDRQINTMFYQRILSSRDKKPVEDEIETIVPKPKYTKIVHDPYVLEFLELEENEHYFENDLEEALLNNPQIGDVIVGTGGARKMRITLEGLGKSGGGRVIYVDIYEKEHLYFLLRKLIFLFRHQKF